MESFLQHALNELGEGRRVFAAMVAANKKGSPGTPAARMLIGEDGHQWGTIGGGIMEKRLAERALVWMGEGRRFLPLLETRRHQQGPEAETSGLFCGGEQSTVFMIWEKGEDYEILSQAMDLINRDIPGVLRVSPRGLDLPDPVLSGRQGVKFEVDSKSWSLYLNLINPRRIAVFGGGHCGVATASLMHTLGYAVTVVEPRADVFTLNKLPPAVQVYRTPYQEAAAHIPFPELTCVVVMTHAFPADVEAILAVLPRPYPEVGVMGSAAKLERIRRALGEAGVNAETMGRLSAPVGLAMDSDTPEEIAVSVAARVLLERRD